MVLAPGLVILMMLELVFYFTNVPYSQRSIGEYGCSHTTYLFLMKGRTGVTVNCAIFAPSTRTTHR
ncbi:hypothetical protein BDQ17DRAFT_854517 [Cyathus striatus]|nr:hypothetical protein BDQ17DRAFT_854517 [Cyathus striatus]